MLDPIRSNLLLDLTGLFLDLLHAFFETLRLINAKIKLWCDYGDNTPHICFSGQEPIHQGTHAPSDRHTKGPMLQGSHKPRDPCTKGPTHKGTSENRIPLKFPLAYIDFLINCLKSFNKLQKNINKYSSKLKQIYLCTSAV